MKEITLPALIQNIDPITDFINEQLEAVDCPIKVQYQIDIAIDELVGNVAQYAYPSGVGEITVRFEALETPRSVVITFIDRGTPYDPLKKADPDVTLALDKRKNGGLGIFLVKKSMDDMTYEYKDGQNILKIQKNI